MNSRPLYLVDESSARVASLDVAFVGDRFEGSISLGETPPHLRQLFEQFEEVVEGQMFSLLDDVEEKIGATPWRVMLEDGREAYVDDLQVYPSRGAVSFKVRHPAAV